MAHITTGCAFCERYFRCDEFLVGTTVKCPHCGAKIEVRPFERTSTGQRSWGTRRLIFAGAFGLCSMVAAAALALWLINRVPQPFPVEPNPVGVGEAGFLSVANQQLIWVGVDEKSVAEWTQTAKQQDQVKLKELMDQKKVFTVRKNTRVSVLEIGPLLNKVRIDDGEHRGSEGWIAPIFIYRTRQ
ncbi:MAG TPA: hypothetical protein VJ783_16780 [Pirellulales bacterium]|nr:hypothetical protein [Pirellulales bacterium]